MKKENSTILILDKFIIKQVLEVFILGIIVFTSIIFASDTFITLVKQITNYGIPFNVALMMILLNLPSIFVLSIPMSVLLSVVMTLNKLCLSSELTILRSCGVSFARISKPIFIFALLMSCIAFLINETIVPITKSQSKLLAVWALGQKNVPNGKQNFTFQETNKEGNLKRLFYIGSCSDNKLKNVTILDLSVPKTIQIIQSESGSTSLDGWIFNNSSVYTISQTGKVLNSSWLGKTCADFGFNIKDEFLQLKADEYNFFQLGRALKKNTNKIASKDHLEYRVKLHDKIALPFTTFVFVLLGIPLSITPPRVRYNRGFLFSILIIFVFYLLRAFSFSLGESGNISPSVAAWLPNIILLILGYYLYYRKVYTI